MTDVYTMLGFGVGIMITILALTVAHKLLTGEITFFSGIEKNILENKTDACTNDNDCRKDGKGVCIGNECVCFVDAHCKNKCDMGTGKCI